MIFAMCSSVGWFSGENMAKRQPWWVRFTSSASSHSDLPLPGQPVTTENCPGAIVRCRSTEGHPVLSPGRQAVLVERGDFFIQPEGVRTSDFISPASGRTVEAVRHPQTAAGSGT
jgi:hypothetical protein